MDKLATWVALLVCILIIPVAMIGCGLLFLKKPPKKVNGWYGYRTSRSMKNQDTWDFAQRYMGKVWWKWGRIMLPPVVLVQALTLLCPDVNAISIWALVLMAAELAVLMASISPVERALKQNFDNNGRRL